ncbi:MAG: hypothetical protein ABSD43_04405 [Terracidiphilus sp.]|jgi:hypothetical protein
MGLDIRATSSAILGRGKMASLEQHKRDCIQFLGSDFEEVHRWLDEFFARFGPLHRFVRHHDQGIREARDRFGEKGGTAALIHILRDCRQIPSKADYQTGRVDALGLKRSWSTAAYIKYADKDFEDLVKEQLKPTGLVLWAFLRWEDARAFLTSVTSYSSEQIAELEDDWKESKRRLDTDSLSLTSVCAFTDIGEITDLPGSLRSYLEAILKKVKESRGGEQGPEVSVGYVSIDTVTNPFVYIDYEFLEDLKPELEGTSPLEIAKFAFPESVTTPITMVGDPTQTTITFSSRQKTMTVSNVRLRSTPEGTEVSYIIGANSSGIVVSDAGDRLVLRNGIHRAYLLAQYGVKEIPCIYVKDRNRLPVVIGAYPTFSPGILVQPRQPLLVDLLRPELCLQAPVRKTHKLIRISADEIMIPVD